MKAARSLPREENCPIRNEFKVSLSNRRPHQRGYEPIKDGGLSGLNRNGLECSTRVPAPDNALKKQICMLTRIKYCMYIMWTVD
jgi:hypothetical protein